MANLNDFIPVTVGDICFGSAASRRVIEHLVAGTIPFDPSVSMGLCIYGAWGTGKTTLARMLPPLLERANSGQELRDPAAFIDCGHGAVGHRLVKSMRSRLMLPSINASLRHYYILDEADNLSAGTLADLKSLMNWPFFVFILTTNNMRALPDPLKDRCIAVQMDPASTEDLLPVARRMAAVLDVHTDDEKLRSAVARSDGSFRRLATNIQGIAANLDAANAPH